MLNKHYHNNDYIQFGMFAGHLTLRLLLKLLCVLWGCAAFLIGGIAVFTYMFFCFLSEVAKVAYAERHNIALAVGLLAAGWLLINAPVVVATVALIAVSAKYVAPVPTT